MGLDALDLSSRSSPSLGLTGLSALESGLVFMMRGRREQIAMEGACQNLLNLPWGLKFAYILEGSPISNPSLSLLRD
jgi:hypothetical protein